MFLLVSVCPQGESTWAGTPPRPGNPPRARYPQDQVHPLGPGTPPDQVPPGPGSPQDQVHPLGPGTPRPGTPPDQVHPPGPDTPPRYIPPDQVHPPRPGTPHPLDQVHPRTRYTSGAVHAGRYGQQAGCTHPTGKHSCLNLNTVW